MAAISFGVQRGSATGNRNDAITLGTNAPSGTSDIELRWNQTDQLGKNLTIKDLKLALKLFARAIERQGNVKVTTANTLVGPP